MKLKNYLIPTLKETPKDAEIASHILMLRAGMIRQVTSGIYNYLPLGLKSLNKVSEIVRKCMNEAGAIEVLMPMVQPAELWKETKRWGIYGKELLRFKDRHDREFCLGPTHEEVITDMARGVLNSYKQLPITLYQIQTKFRDEVRPKYGLFRGREFLMKDAYSFDMTQDGLDASYEIMRKAYENVFNSIGIQFRCVDADSGSIGGSASNEFMVLAETGDDIVVYCESCSYSANVEKATFAPVKTPATGEVVNHYFRIEVGTEVKFAKTHMLGKRHINEVKVKSLYGADGIIEIDASKVDGVCDLLVDNEVLKLLDFDQIKFDGNYVVCDIRDAEAGDTCSRCGSTLKVAKGIEVGHIFKLGFKYSEPMGLQVLTGEGSERSTVYMGCYGIGVSRLMQSVIEQSHDDKGIVWPVSVAPFEVCIVVANQSDEPVSEFGYKIYDELGKSGVDVAIDDRDERAGFKFKDAELIGYPLVVVVGSKGFEAGEVELRVRATGDVVNVPLNDAVSSVMNKLNELRTRKF